MSVSNIYTSEILDVLRFCLLVERNNHRQLESLLTLVKPDLPFQWNYNTILICPVQISTIYIAHYKITTLLLVELNHTPFSLMQLITSLWHLSDFTAFQPETRHIALKYRSPTIDTTVRIVLSTHQWIECSHTS